MFTTENKDGKWWVVEQPDPNLSSSNGLSGAHIGKLQYDEVSEDLEIVPYAEYPTLPEDASHWAALQGKMFGEGEFEAIPCCNTDCTGLCKVVGNLYAIPKQAEEDIEEYHGDDSLWYDVKGLFVSAMEKNVTPEEAINLMKSLGYQITRGKQPQPAIPASDEEGWEEVLNKICGYSEFALERYGDILNFLTTNYHPPKRK